MKKLKLCVVTGSRADYGLLSWLMRIIRADKNFELFVTVTGSHLSKQFGLTYREIQADGFRINRRIPILSQEASPVAVTKAFGKAVLGFADLFHAVKPAWLVVLGDRYEVLAAVSAALIAKIPVAHLAGGDITEGAMDNAIRHAITKMSHIHFATHKTAAHRICQLGEDPKTVFNVGHIGLDGIRHTIPMNRQELEKRYRIRLQKYNLLITFHPVTLDSIPSRYQFGEVLNALSSLDKNHTLIFTAANADSHGNQINRMIKRFVETHPNAYFVPSLGHRAFLSLLRLVDMMVGNSSSGIYEVPSFKIPTIDIGSRQSGRIQAASVIHCVPKASAISKAILSAYKKDCSKVKNPYGDGQTAPRILRILKRFRNPQSLLKKRFIEV